jgi:hypothetical protein
MRTTFPLVLAAIAMGFGMGEASATNLDLKQFSSGASEQAIQALDPSLGQGAGFSALTPPASAVTGAASAVTGETSSKALSAPVESREALVRPEEGDSCSACGALGGVANKDIASREAIAGAPEMPLSNGFAALKAEGARGAIALDGLTGRDASPGLLQRPAGTQWSNGFQGLRQ